MLELASDQAQLSKHPERDADGKDEVTKSQ